MEASLGPLLPLYERERSSGRALALGVLAQVEGSTYRKPGALMLIADNGEYAGLLSGGCLEGDLREHARAVIATGAACPVRYDFRGPEDDLWGLGLGCEGAMQILLLRVGPENDWQPVAEFNRALAARSQTAIGVVVESRRADVPLGSLVLPEETRRPPVAALRTPAVAAALTRATVERSTEWVEGDNRAWKLFVVPLALPPRILVLGAGPDAAPVVDFAALLDWKVTLVDHRAAYAVPRHFPAAERVVYGRPDELAANVDLRSFSAAVVMSHHLTSDLGYLRALALAEVPYVGLLSPAARREKLLAQLGPLAERLQGRLHSPVGLRLGGRAPQSVALAIVAELHAFLHLTTAGSAATATASSAGTA
jgi:xanthine/CO dehydrogenase XdhC/CoxF family maturation factor